MKKNLDTSRVLVAVILSLVLVFAYQELVLKRLYPPPPEQAAQKAKTRALGTSPSAKAPIPAPSAVSTPAAAAPPALPAPAGGPERLVVVDTDLYRATFTTRGARLKSFKLKRYRETASPQSPPYEMIRPSADGRLPLGALAKTDGEVADDHLLNYSTDSPPEIKISGTEKATITFTAQASNGLKLQKQFTLDANQYVLGMRVTSLGPEPAALGIGMTEPLTERGGEGYYNVPELQADVENKVYTENEKALKKGVAPVFGKITYAGFGDRYFLSAYLPESPASGVLDMASSDSDASARLLFSKTSTVTAKVYMGPKELETLETANPSLNKAIDFGWTGMIALPFLRALKLFHLFAPNWGWDIILLTVALRLLMLPMSIKGQRSMIRMQRLQPQMERLRSQFKDDPQQLNKEMVDLYKRNHVNPVGGCAPMVIQLPVFIGLYEALLNAIELRHASFIWWIKDLSAADCFHISSMPKLPYIHCQGLPVLVLLMGLSTYVQQWMSPTSPDPNQQRMMMLTPIIFTIMLVNFPAGLSLYYFASNVLGIVQQMVLNREFKQLAPAT